MNITGLTKVNYKTKAGEELNGISMKDYYAAKAKDIGVKGEQGSEFVKMAVNLAFKEGFEIPEALSAKAKANLEKLSKSVKADLESSAKAREEAKAKKAADEEKAKIEAEKRKASASSALVKAEEKVGSKISAAITKTVDDAAAKYLGKGFKVENGNLVATSKNLSESDFAAGFAGLKSLLESTEAIGKGFAKLEAQMAILAENQYGADWPNFFSSDPSRVSVIKKNMAVLKLSSELGVELTTSAGDIPVGVARAMLEANVSKGEPDSDARNKEFKREVLEEFIEKSNEAGRVLTANEARNLVNEKKNAARGDAGAKIQFNILYVFNVKGLGTKFIPSKDKKPDPEWLSKAAFAVDRALNIMRMVKGDIIVQPAALPDQGEMKEILDALLIKVKEPKAEESKVPAKKNAPKKEEPVVLEDDEDEDEEDAVDPEDDNVDESPDDDLALGEEDTEAEVEIEDEEDDEEDVLDLD